MRTKSDKLEYAIYKDPTPIGRIIDENRFRKVYMEVRLKNTLRRDFVIEANNLVLGEIMLKPDPIKKHIEYFEKDISVFKGKFVKYVILTDYKLDTKSKIEFSHVLGDSNLKLYNIVVNPNGIMEVNWEIGRECNSSTKLQFNEIVNEYGKNHELVEYMEYIKMNCDSKNFHNFKFCNGNTERFGSTINNLEFYINCYLIELKYNSIKKFNSNKSLIDNIINSVGVWRYNKKLNGIYIPAQKTNECCQVLNKTIELFDNYYNIN